MVPQTSAAPAPSARACTHATTRPGRRVVLLPAVARLRSIAPYSSVGERKSSTPKLSRPTWTALKLPFALADSYGRRQKGEAEGIASEPLLVNYWLRQPIRRLLSSASDGEIVRQLTSHSCCLRPCRRSIHAGDCAPCAERLPGVAVPAIGRSSSFCLGGSSSRPSRRPDPPGSEERVTGLGSSGGGDRRRGEPPTGYARCGPPDAAMAAANCDREFTPCSR
jgi:hypothetical protein